MTLVRLIFTNFFLVLWTLLQHTLSSPISYASPSPSPSVFSQLIFTDLLEIGIKCPSQIRSHLLWLLFRKSFSSYPKRSSHFWSCWRIQNLNVTINLGTSGSVRQIFNYASFLNYSSSLRYSLPAMKATWKVHWHYLPQRQRRNPITRKHFPNRSECSSCLLHFSLSWLPVLTHYLDSIFWKALYETFSGVDCYRAQTHIRNLPRCITQRKNSHSSLFHPSSIALRFLLTSLQPKNAPWNLWYGSDQNN